MQSNCQFELVPPIEQYFRLYFDLTDDEKLGKYMTAAEIFDCLKKHIGSSVKVNSLRSFGRKLVNISGIKVKRFTNGKRYLVVEKASELGWNDDTLAVSGSAFIPCIIQKKQ